MRIYLSFDKNSEETKFQLGGKLGLGGGAEFWEGQCVDQILTLWLIIESTLVIKDLWPSVL